MAEEQENAGAEPAGPDAGTAPEAPTAPAAPAATPPAVPAAATPPREPVEIVAPKERRRRARTAKAAATPRRPPRSPQERQAEREQDRRRKAAARRSERQHARAKARTAGGEAQATPPRERGPGKQKTRQGIVVSDRAEKTITVRIDVARRHRRYEKIVRTSTTLHAHDERGDAHIGDTVIVRECRPLSRTKHWRLVEVVVRAQ